MKYLLFILFTAVTLAQTYDVGQTNANVSSALTKALAQPDSNTVYRNALLTKAPKASPTFTGTVTMPTPFTLGAVSVLPTGTELNYVDGVTSAIQTQLNNKQASDADLTDLADGSLTASKVAGVADADYGDVTVSSGTWAVEDDSHNHVISNVDALQDSLTKKLNKGDSTLYATQNDIVGDTLDFTGTQLNNLLDNLINMGTDSTAISSGEFYFRSSDGILRRKY